MGIAGLLGLARPFIMTSRKETTMGLTILKFTDAKEEVALARHRESQSAEETTHSAGTSSPPSAAPSPAPSAQRDHVGQPLPRGSRLTDLQSSDSELTSITYTVQRGDTLRGIADWFYGDRSLAEEIFAANRSMIRDPEQLEPGTVLHIPRHGGATPLS
jgi:nucleoid-associated protein YgaU